MRLSKLYSNNNDIFPPILFNQGLNVIFAKVKHPKNHEKDSHNLGKTLLIELLDFLLLKQIKQKAKFFLTKHHIFQNFEFYLEIKTNQGDYVTIKRRIEQNTKIALIKHPESKDFTGSDHDSNWQHSELAVGKAVQLLDSYLNLTVIKPYSYRQGVGYFLRTQRDYLDVFRIDKFSRGEHKEWKPYIAKILGLDSDLLIKKYDLKNKLAEHEKNKKKLLSQIPFNVREYDNIKGQMQIKLDEIDDISKKLDIFDYHEREIAINQELVDDIEARINEINLDLYNIEFDLNKINTAFSEKIHFDREEIKQIFAEARIYFSEQMIKDYDALLIFNEKLTTERYAHLSTRKEQLEQRQTELINEHQRLSQQRQDYLDILQESDFLEKYKKLQKNLDKKRADLALLEKQLELSKQISQLEDDISHFKREDKALSEEIKHLIEVKDKPLLEEIRKNFNQIIATVLNTQAFPFIKQNKEGNLEFDVQFVTENADKTTSEAEGHTYKKFLCMTFDLALLRTYSQNDFYRFVYHDGALEQLDNRKKCNFINLIREYCNSFNIQYILSLIDSDLPRDSADQKMTFSAEEIIRELHDDGDGGRLFRMPKF